MTRMMIDDPKALDQYLALMGDDGPEFVIDIIESFLDSSQGYFDDLDQSLLENDFTTFRRSAHSIKTGCAIVGATELAKEFLTLEEAGATNNLLAVDRTLEKCKQEFKKLTVELLQKKGTLS